MTVIPGHGSGESKLGNLGKSGTNFHPRSAPPISFRNVDPTRWLGPIPQSAYPLRQLGDPLLQSYSVVLLLYPIHSARLVLRLALEALAQALQVTQQSHHGIEAFPHKFSRPLCETDKFRCHGFTRPCVRSMSPLSVASYRHPFAPPALPGFSALMGGPDFRQPPLSSSLLTLVRECVFSLTPTGGSPWLPRILHVRLDTA